MNAQSGTDFATQDAIHAQGVNVGRYSLRIIRVMEGARFNERSLDYNLAGEVFGANQPRLRDLTVAHCGRSEKESNRRAE